MQPPGFTLCVGEEGPLLEEFNLDVVIGMWFLYKLHDLASGLDQPKSKQEEGVASISYIGLWFYCNVSLRRWGRIQEFVWQFCLFYSIGAQHVSFIFAVWLVISAPSRHKERK